MQIIELTEWGVRSAALRLRRPGTPMSYVIYPMIHMAEASFYADVTRRLRPADVIVAEGVDNGDGFSAIGRAITLSYAVLRFNRRTRPLVEQDIDYGALDAEIVRPDVTGAEFRDAFRRVPFRHRAVMWMWLPVVVLTRMFGGARTVWSRSVELDDLPTIRQEQITEAAPELDEAFLGDRDERLLRALYRLHEERGTEDIEVAVVYGAGHVTAIVHGLCRRHGYRPRSAEWLTVTSL